VSEGVHDRAVLGGRCFTFRSKQPLKLIGFFGIELLLVAFTEFGLSGGRLTH
jgi:hypothetical protein